MSIPYSAQAEWAGKAVVIDDCFLRCHGRILKDIVGEDKLIQFDALFIHTKHSGLYGINEVPEEERKETARKTADAIRSKPKEEKLETSATADCASGAYAPENDKSFSDKEESACDS